MSVPAEVPGYRLFVIAAVLGSAALLAGAFAFQAMGYPPCDLCIRQRWPHGWAIAAGLVVLLLGAVLHGRGGGARPGRRGLLLLILAGALSAATTGVLGIYHTGIEQGWWEGQTACAAPASGIVSLDQILSNTTIIRCDEAIWSFLGLSMASWNAAASLFLAGLWLLAARDLSRSRA